MKFRYGGTKVLEYEDIVVKQSYLKSNLKIMIKRQLCETRKWHVEGFELIFFWTERCLWQTGRFFSLSCLTGKVISVCNFA